MVDLYDLSGHVPRKYLLPIERERIFGDPWENQRVLTRLAHVEDWAARMTPLLIDPRAVIVNEVLQRAAGGNVRLPLTREPLETNLGFAYQRNRVVGDLTVASGLASKQFSLKEILMYFPFGIERLVDTLLLPLENLARPMAQRSIPFVPDAGLEGDWSDLAGREGNRAQLELSRGNLTNGMELKDEPGDPAGGPNSYGGSWDDESLLIAMGLNVEPMGSSGGLVADYTHPQVP